MMNALSSHLQTKKPPKTSAGSTRAHPTVSGYLQHASLMSTFVARVGHFPFVSSKIVFVEKPN